MVIANILPVLIVPLLGWRFYSRYRKLVGVQTVRPFKLWASVCAFPAILLLTGIATLAQTATFEGLLLGAAAGFALALLGLKLTAYQAGDSGLSYTPNMFIGMALSMLFFSRVVYRGYQIYTASATQTSLPLTTTPLTMAVVGLILAYYPTYSAGILRWRKRMGGQAAESVPVGNKQM